MTYNNICTILSFEKNISNNKSDKYIYIINPNILLTKTNLITIKLLCPQNHLIVVTWQCEAAQNPGNENTRHKIP